MPRFMRLPSGPQRLALAVGHDSLLLSPDFTPRARHADAEFEPHLGERLAGLSRGVADRWAAAVSGEPHAAERDSWAPEIPEWAESGERTAHGYTLVENVALIEVEGLLMARGFQGYWSGCYWPGYRDYVAALKAANEDERVDAVLMRFDTPGGYVTGCAEAAQAIRALRAENGGKPIIGHASELCASAGMKLAAQCDAFYAGDGAVIGSVGVRIGFFDLEGALERWGERSHLYKSGRLKDMGSMLRAPTDEEAGIYQAEVDHLADRFYVELAAGRGLDLNALRESRGWEARTFTAGDPPPPADLDPLAVDLIDAVMTEESAFQIAQSLGAPPSLSAPSAVASRAVRQRDSDAAVSKVETPMSLIAKAAALKARAKKGDVKAQAELDRLLATLGANAEYQDPDAEDGEDDAEGEGEDDDADAMDDDAEGEGEDDDANAEDGDDDEAGAEDDDEDDDAEAVLAHPSAKGREALAGQLSVQVARGKLTKAQAIGMLKSAPKGSSFRNTAGANTPSGVRQAGAGSGKGKGKTTEADALLSRAHKSLGTFTD